MELVRLRIFPDLALSGGTRTETTTRLRPVDPLEKLDLAAVVLHAGLGRHLFRVIDVRPDGIELTIGSRSATAQPEDVLLTALIPLEPLLKEGVHRLCVEVDGERLDTSINVAVRNGSSGRPL
jgi:hypothetical protein